MPLPTRAGADLTLMRAFCYSPNVQVLSWPPYLHQPDPVLSSLHGIFLQLAQQGGSHAELAKRGGTPAPRPAVDAEPLREALARLPGRALRLGEPSRELFPAFCVS